MSYILDALRKADAERERGAVPGLHTQPVPGASSAPASARRGPPTAALAAGVAAVAAVGLALLWFDRDVPAPEPARTVASGAVTEPAPAAPPATAPMPAPAPVATAPVAPPPPAPVPVPPSVTAAREAAARSEAARTPPPPLGGMPGAGSARTAATRNGSPPTTPGTPGAPAAEERVYAVNELPEHIRREWPSLAIGGSIYSETPASRFLIINGRIFHEGDTVATDLSLEQIRLKAAVLRYKGYRVGITY